jgi:YesN/AraC family two-component response regulator
MTKTEKKKIIASLLDEVINSTDIDSKQKKLSAVISEIYSSGYKLDDLIRVSKIIDLFLSDFIKNQTDKSFLKLSRLGLITCIDWSLLHD